MIPCKSFPVEAAAQMIFPLPNRNLLQFQYYITRIVRAVCNNDRYTNIPLTTYIPIVNQQIWCFIFLKSQHPKAKALVWYLL